MRQPTALELVLAGDAEFVRLKTANAPAGDIQKRLDEIATEVCQKAGADELTRHMWFVYEETAPTYAKNPEHGNVPDALLAFMNHVPEYRGKYVPHVLDLGCGTGRDAVFMALQDPEARKQFMGRMKDGKSALERFGLPQKSFHVEGIDASRAMMSHAACLAEKYGFDQAWYGSRDHLLSSVRFAECIGMHHLRADRLRTFDGVWSSAALFMHTPKELIGLALDGVRRVLYGGGVFGVSYANNATNLPYDNLRYSRTGEIKYFSRPTPQMIVAAAALHGLDLFEEQYSDLEMAGEVKKDFFVTQFYRKHQ